MRAAPGNQVGGAGTDPLGPQGFRSLSGTGIRGRPSCRGPSCALWGVGSTPHRDDQRCLPTLASTRVRGKIAALSPPTPALTRDETPTQLCPPGRMALLGWGLRVQRPPVLSPAWRPLGELPAGAGGSVRTTRPLPHCRGYPYRSPAGNSRLRRAPQTKISFLIFSQ